MVVHLPEGRDIVIDVKTPLDAYLTGGRGAERRSARGGAQRHAQHVADRVRMLSSKNYAAQFEQAPQFVVLFLPGDQFLSSALDQQPDLLDRAMNSNIILTTPSTLLALLKTVYNGWQNVRLAENAERIRGLAEDLYARLATFRNHMGKVGSSLEASINAFNAAVGSLERSVLPGARKFVELGVRTDKPIEELDRSKSPRGSPRDPRHASRLRRNIDRRQTRAPPTLQDAARAYAPQPGSHSRAASSSSPVRATASDRPSPSRSPARERPSPCSVARSASSSALMTGSLRRAARSRRCCRSTSKLRLHRNTRPCPMRWIGSLAASMGSRTSPASSAT